MESIAVTKPDMTVTRQELLSPFGLLTQLFTAELVRRNEHATGMYRPMQLAFLEDEGNEALPAPPEIHFDLNVDLIVNRLMKQAQEEKKKENKTSTQRILERVILREREIRTTYPETRRIVIESGGRRVSADLPVKNDGQVNVSAQTVSETLRPIGEAKLQAGEGRSMQKTDMPRRSAVLKQPPITPISVRQGEGLQKGRTLTLASQTMSVPAAGGWTPKQRELHPGYPTQAEKEKEAGLPTGSILLPDVMRRRREAALERRETPDFGAESLENALEWAVEGTVQTPETERVLRDVRRAVSETLRRNELRSTISDAAKAGETSSVFQEQEAGRRTAEEAGETAAGKHVLSAAQAQAAASAAIPVSQEARTSSQAELAFRETTGGAPDQRRADASLPQTLQTVQYGRDSARNEASGTLSAAAQPQVGERITLNTQEGTPERQRAVGPAVAELPRDTKNVFPDTVRVPESDGGTDESVPTARHPAIPAKDEFQAQAAVSADLVFRSEAEETAHAHSLNAQQQAMSTAQLPRTAEDDHSAAAEDERDNNDSTPGWTKQAGPGSVQKEAGRSASTVQESTPENQRAGESAAPDLPRDAKNVFPDAVRVPGSDMRADESALTAPQPAIPSTEALSAAVSAELVFRPETEDKTYELPQNSQQQATVTAQPPRIAADDHRAAADDQRDIIYSTPDRTTPDRTKQAGAESEHTQAGHYASGAQESTPERQQAGEPVASELPRDAKNVFSDPMRVPEPYGNADESALTAPQPAIPTTEALPSAAPAELVFRSEAEEKAQQQATVTARSPRSAADDHRTAAKEKNGSIDLASGRMEYAGPGSEHKEAEQSASAAQKNTPENQWAGESAAPELPCDLQNASQKVLRASESGVSADESALTAPQAAIPSTEALPTAAPAEMFFRAEAEEKAHALNAQQQAMVTAQPPRTAADDHRAAAENQRDITHLTTDRTKQVGTESEHTEAGHSASAVQESTPERQQAGEPAASELSRDLQNASQKVLRASESSVSADESALTAPLPAIPSAEALPTAAPAELVFRAEEETDVQANGKPESSKEKSAEPQQTHTIPAQHPVHGTADTASAVTKSREKQDAAKVMPAQTDRPVMPKAEPRTFEQTPAGEAGASLARPAIPAQEEAPGALPADLVFRADAKTDTQELPRAEDRQTTAEGAPRSEIEMPHTEPSTHTEQLTHTVSAADGQAEKQQETLWTAMPAAPETQPTASAPLDYLATETAPFSADAPQPASALPIQAETPDANVPLTHRQTADIQMREGVFSPAKYAPLHTESKVLSPRQITARTPEVKSGPITHTARQALRDIRVAGAHAARAQDDAAEEPWTYAEALPAPESASTQEQTELFFAATAQNEAHTEEAAARPTERPQEEKTPPLPAWAKELLEQSGVTDTVQQTAVFNGASSAAGKINWSAPAAPHPLQSMDGSAEMQFRERAEAEQTPYRTPISDADLQRTADRVYRIIEERLRRELRRSGR